MNGSDYEISDCEFYRFKMNSDLTRILRIHECICVCVSYLSEKSISTPLRPVFPQELLDSLEASDCQRPRPEYNRSFLSESRTWWMQFREYRSSDHSVCLNSFSSVLMCVPCSETFSCTIYTSNTHEHSATGGRGHKNHQANTRWSKSSALLVFNRTGNWKRERERERVKQDFQKCTWKPFFQGSRGKMNGAIERLHVVHN